MAAIESTKVKRGRPSHYRGESFGNSLPLASAQGQRVPPLPIKLDTKPLYSAEIDLPSKIETDSLAKSHREADTMIRLNQDGCSEVMKRSMSKTDSIRDLNTFFSKSDPARPEERSLPYADRKVSSTHSLPRDTSQRSLHSILSQQEIQQLLKSQSSAQMIEEAPN